MVNQNSGQLSQQQQMTMMMGANHAGSGAATHTMGQGLNDAAGMDQENNFSTFAAGQTRQPLRNDRSFSPRDTATLNSAAQPERNDFAHIAQTPPQTRHTAIDLANHMRHRANQQFWRA